MRFFDVLADDNRFANRRFLGEPVSESSESIDARLFRYGKRYEGPLPKSVPVKQNGVLTAFNLGAFDMPVVSNDIVKAIQAVTATDCEFFPVFIEGASSQDSILNATCRIACVDETRCQVLKWHPEDNRPDRLGCYRSIRDLRIDPSKVGEHHIFRIFGWEVSLIVSERIREMLANIENLGVVFNEVT